MRQSIKQQQQKKAQGISGRSFALMDELRSGFFGYLSVGLKSNA
jgi:hypothetical protein